MLFLGITLIYLYICCVGATSVVEVLEHQASKPPTGLLGPEGASQLSLGPILVPPTTASTGLALITSSDEFALGARPRTSSIEATVPTAGNRFEQDLFKRRSNSKHKAITEDDTHNNEQAAEATTTTATTNMAGLANRNDNIYLNSIDFGPPYLPDVPMDANASSAAKTLDELEKVEMHTNNHQSAPTTTTIATLYNNNHNGHHSRHYNTYQHGVAALSLANMGHYGNNKYSPAAHSGFANSLNLNYIHSLLAKPVGMATAGASGGALSSLLNAASSAGTANHVSPYGHVVSLQSSGYAASAAPSSSASLSSPPGASSYYSSAAVVPPPSINGISSQQPQRQQPVIMEDTPPEAPQQPPAASLNGQQQQPLAISPVDFSGSTMCGRQQVGSREPRIVGGNNTYEGEFPWAVSVQRHGNHHCGGVIVGRRWILTAAHCVRNQLVGNLIVRTGGHTLSRSGNNINSHLERDYLVDQIVMHGDFSRYDNLTSSQMKSSANTNNADIALLRLKHDIHWNELAWPVCFPNREAGNFSGHDAVVIGWGKLNEKSEDFSNELQKVKLTIIDNKVCQNWFRQAGRDMPIDDRIICAGFKNGGKDACHGDSGGPLLSKINGHYVVVGVVSTGIGCARPLLPGLYSRVSSYINWIERYVT